MFVLGCFNAALLCCWIDDQSCVMTGVGRMAMSKLEGGPATRTTWARSINDVNFPAAHRLLVVVLSEFGSIPGGEPKGIPTAALIVLIP